MAVGSVNYAARHGHLAVGDDGKIDPRHPGNRAWIDTRRNGIDGLGRLLPARRRAAETAVLRELAEAGRAGLDFSAWLDRELAAARADRGDKDAWLDELLAGLR